ncbi:phasin family protein [Methylobacterium oxalidis]|uniref:phasin family protein n=1 Tax=Methylobacterium oxalidis TaxID=944322 RepID=UPI0033159282
MEPAHAEPQRAASAQPERSEATVERTETGAGASLAARSNQPPSSASSEAAAQGKGAQPASGWRGRAPAQAEALAGPLSLARAAVEANVTVWSYLRKESEAAVAHFRALSSAKSPTDALALQAHEMSRALNAALSLGQDLAGLTTGAKEKQ